MAPDTKGKSKKRHIKTQHRDEFRGPMTGVVDLARNDGDVIAYSEIIYIGNGADKSEPTQVPISKHKARKKANHTADEDNDEDASEKESSGDDRPRGAVFHGPISGFIREARGAGNVIAFKKVTHIGADNEKHVLNDSRSEDSGVQQRLHLQKETEMITKKFFQDKRLPTRNDIEQPMVVDSQHEALDMKSLMKELEASSPKMQRFISSLVQKGDMERQHMLDHER